MHLDRQSLVLGGWGVAVCFHCADLMGEKRTGTSAVVLKLYFFAYQKKRMFEPTSINPIPV